MPPPLKDIANDGLERKETVRSGTGTIISTSWCSAVVRVAIDGTANDLPFSKALFYTFGIKCDGRMDNILENDMEVYVSYKFSPIRSKPCIVAVWIGDQPDDLEGDHVLNAIYGQKSQVKLVNGENVIVQCDSSGEYAIIEKRVIFRDGYPLNERNEFKVRIDENITIDAIPVKLEWQLLEHPVEVLFRATCGWFDDKEPRLVDRFSLRSTGTDHYEGLGQSGQDVCHGVVTVIPNDAVAIVEVLCVASEVIVFRSSFKQCYKRMQDVVAVGDTVRLRLRSANMFPANHCKQWFAVEAWRTGGGIKINKAEECEKKPSKEFASSMFGTLGSCKPDKTSDHTLTELCSQVGRTKINDKQTELNLSAEGAQPVISKREIPKRRKVKGDDDGDNMSLTEASISSSMTFLKSEQTEDNVENGKSQSSLKILETLYFESSAGKRASELSVTSRVNAVEGGQCNEDVEYRTLSKDKPEAVLEVEKNGKEIDGITTLGAEASVATPEAEQTGKEKNESRQNSEPTVEAVNSDVGSSGDSTQERTSEVAAKCESTGTDDEYEDYEKACESYTDFDDQGLEVANFDRESPVLFSCPPLSGVISRHSFDSACVSYEDLKILVGHRFVYIDGSLCTTEQFLKLVSPGTNVVNFEAVHRHGNDSDSSLTHVAVCVWVGEKPSLATVLSVLPPPMLSLAEDKDKIFTGNVAKLYLPKVAIIVFDHEDKQTSACLHMRGLSSQKKCRKRNPSGMNCIADYVKLHTFVEFRLRRNAAHPQILEACQISYAGKKLRYELKMKFARDTVITSSLKRLPPLENPGEVSSSPVVYSSSNFDSDRPSKRRAFLLNFPGTLRYEDRDDLGNFKIEYAMGHCFAAQSNTYQIARIDPRTGQKRDAIQVNFDAELVGSWNVPESVLVKTVWSSGDFRPSPERCLLRELSYKDSRFFVRSKSFHGKIISIPFYNCAIALVEECKVLVPLESVVFAEKTNPDWHTIDVFFSEGDVVSLRIAEQRYKDENGLKFLKAFECWKLVRYTADGLSSDLKSTSISEDLSWDEKWGKGEYYLTKRLVKREGRYCVQFHSSKRPGVLLRMTLLRQGVVFVDGEELVDPEELDSFVDRDVTFHVAHVHPDRLLEKSAYGMFIRHAWIGNEPPLSELLLDAIVRKGLVNQEYWYEAFVEDFPLPTHAVCKIGHVSVLIALRKVEQNGVFVRADTDLKIKQRVLLRVKEVDWKTSLNALDTAFLVACEVKSCANVTAVLRNVSGTIVSLPQPTGKIKIDDSDTEVDFELCHMCNWEEGLLAFTKALSWFSFLKKFLKIGERVTVTAARNDGNENSHRAIEVRLMREVRLIRKSKASEEDPESDADAEN